MAYRQSMAHKLSFCTAQLTIKRTQSLTYLNLFGTPVKMSESGKE